VYFTVRHFHPNLKFAGKGYREPVEHHKGSTIIACIVKNTFGFTILYWYSLQCYWQVLQTSNDPDQQSSAPFKAGNSRQVQTCYKAMVQTQRKLQHFLVSISTGEKRVLMTLKHWASTQWRSPFLRAQTLSLLAKHKLLHFVLAEWNNAVITLANIRLDCKYR